LTADTDPDKEKTMRRLMTLVAVAAVCLSFAAVAGLARDGAATTAAPLAVTNKICPLAGEETSPKFRVEYEGQYVYFCCGGCVEQFKADPATAVAKLSAEDKAAIQKNTVCPVSGEKLDSYAIRSETDGKLVYFCCDHCKAKWDKEHPAA